jgi:molybdate transport system substrate-binding protein
MSGARRAPAPAPALALVACLLVGCGPTSAARREDPPGGGTLTVFAAASLTSTFTELGERFENSHPGTDVIFNFTADQATMNRAVSQGLVSGRAQQFATNTLIIAVPPANPNRIGGLAALTDPQLKVVVCAPAVPCGAAANAVEAAAGVTLAPVSEEGSVTDVLNKVSTGQADAGLVYVTDVITADGAVTGVSFPQSTAAVNRYPIASVSSSQNPRAAADFIALVTGPEGRQVLADAGFGSP